MQKTLEFGATIVFLILVGLAILYLSLFPQHKPRIDDGTLPKLPLNGPR